MFYRPDGRSADGRRSYEKGGKGGNNTGPGSPAAIAQEARQDEEERKAEIRDTRAEVDRHFTGFDEPYFRNISDSYLQLNAPLLAEQAAKARHDLPYKFARTDNSDYQRVLAELAADQAREETNLKDKALDVANQQRANVEKNRADLVQLANSGTDAGSIATQSANRAASLAKPETFSPIADLFSKYAQNYALGSQVGGDGTGRSFARALNFGAPRSAVKTVG
jgi:hypothetical protein